MFDCRCRGLSTFGHGHVKKSLFLYIYKSSVFMYQFIPCSVKSCWFHLSCSWLKSVCALQIGDSVLCEVLMFALLRVLKWECHSRFCPVFFCYKLQRQRTKGFIVQELCESRGGRPGLSVLTSLLVSVDVKIYCTVLRHWSQLVPNMSHDI